MASKRKGRRAHSGKSSSKDHRRALRGGSRRVTPKGTRSGDNRSARKQADTEPADTGSRSDAADTRSNAELLQELREFYGSAPRSLTVEIGAYLDDLHRSIKRFGGEHSLLETEAVLADCVGTSTRTSWSDHGAKQAEALEFASSQRSEAAAVAVAALAVYGDTAVTSKARTVLGELIESGIAVPEWVIALGAAEPVRARKLRDVWDDHWTIVVTYASPDGSEHEIWSSIHPYFWGMAYQFAVTSANARLMREADGTEVIEELSLAEARAILDHGISEYDASMRSKEEAAGLFDDDWDWEADEGDLCLRPLVGQRIRLLPEADPGHSLHAVPSASTVFRRGSYRFEGEAVEITKEFNKLPRPSSERPSDLGDLAFTLGMFNSTCRVTDGLRWTPPKVHMFIEHWLPNFGLETGGDWTGFDAVGDGFEPSAEWLATLNSAFPRWLRFAAERRGDPDELLQENLESARASLRELHSRAAGS